MDTARLARVGAALNGKRFRHDRSGRDGTGDIPRHGVSLHASAIAHAPPDDRAGTVDGPG